MLTSSHSPDERRSYISGILAVAATAIFLVLSITVPADGVPVKHDFSNKSLPLEILPPLRDDEHDVNATHKDSYGNALETLQPINTADGRKIINVHGIEFPIPKYASGITSITRPSDELLPPPAVSLPSTERSYASTSTFTSNSGNPREVKVKLYPNNVFLNEAIKSLDISRAAATQQRKDLLATADSMNEKVTVTPYGVLTPTVGAVGDVRRRDYTTEATQRPPTASPSPLPRPSTRTAVRARIGHVDFNAPPGILQPYDTLASSKATSKF